MILKRLMLAGLFCTAAAGAFARQDPTPPPSGIVVHLFGPHSVMGDVHPLAAVMPRHKPAPGGGGDAGPMVQTAAGPGAEAAIPPANIDNATEPTMGDVLHQLFVTGDGTAAKPSAGRGADRPAD